MASHTAEASLAAESKERITTGEEAADFIASIL
jgi:hypothetical protein